MPSPHRQIVELASRLVAVESVNPALVPGGAGERAAAALVAEWCTERGLDVEVVGDERPSVIARRRGSGGGRSLLLNGHLDTVGVAGMTAPFEPRVENGRLYGRGSYDMKGALAALLVAAAEASGLRGDVMGPVSPLSACNSSPVPASQTRAVSSALPVAIRFPSGEKATDSILSL